MNKLCLALQASDSIKSQRVKLFSDSTSEKFAVRRSRTIAACLDCGHHFVLPQELSNTAIKNLDLDGMFPEGVTSVALQLPYDAFTIQYTAMGVGSTPDVVAYVYRTPDPTQLGLDYVLKFQGENYWRYSYSSIIIHSGFLDERIAFSMATQDENVLKLVRRQAAASKISLDTALDTVGQACYDVSGRALIRLLYALNKTHDITSQKTVANRKTKKGATKKKATYTFHTLIVKPTTTTEDEILNKGTHASPAQHDRRGHWRYLKKSDKKVWVRNCVVGSLLNGRVDKDYEITM